MKHADCKIGMEFTAGVGRRWCVTDVGTRVIVAICMSDHPADWRNGLPYAVAECVFDENDLTGCAALRGPPADLGGDPT